MHLEWAVSRPACTDRDLVDRMRSGDEAALFDLYVSYGRRLFAQAFRITGSADRAEDVVQASLLAAWRATRSYRGDGSFLCWLLGIVRNQALNAVRRKAPTTTTLDEAEELAGTAARPDDVLEARERESGLRTALARLSPEHREVLDLVFYQGLTLAEIAEVCGCPVGTVKSRLHAAKARLRAVLAGAGAEVQR